MAKVTGSFTIVVKPAVVALALDGSFPDEQVGVAASGGVTASGGVPPYKFTVSAGSLPPGVNLDASTGVLSGAPTSEGTANFEVTVEDSQ